LGGDDDGGPLNAIAAAAERTQHEQGGRAAMRAIVSSPEQSEPLRMTGRFVFDAEDRTGGTLTFADPESGDPVRMQLVGDGTVMYMRSSLFDPLPDGREWMSLDVSFGREPDAPLPANGDAKGELELLEAVTGDVQKLGEEEVRGVPTTHYRGAVGVSEQTERLQEEGGEDIAAYLEEEGAPLRVEAWIDAEGLIRRMRYVQSRPGDGGEEPTTIDMRTDFFDFGIEPEIDVPDSDEVFDATGLAEEEIERAGG
jgi:hypothetical protein